MSFIPFTRIRLWPILLIIVALALGFYGQKRFSESLDPTFDAVLAFALAAICLFAAEGLARDPASSAAVDGAETVPTTISQGTAWLLRWRWMLTGVAFAIGAWVAWVLYQQSPGEDATTPALPWVLAWVLLLVIWMPLPRPTHVRAWVRSHPGELAIVVALIVLAGVIRLWGLADYPYTLSGDEGSIGIEIRRVLNGEIQNPFTLGWGPLPTLSYFVQSIPARFLGLTPWTLRLVNVLFGILAIPMLYLLARLLFNRPTALAAAMLLAGYHVHHHYSRATINVIFDTAFYPATLSALVYGLRYRATAWPFVLAGVLAGLAQYSNVGARLLPILIVAFLSYLWLFARSWLNGKQDYLLLMLVAFLVVAGPMGVYALQHPDDYNARMNQIGIVQSGWLENQERSRNVGALPILAEQFQYVLFGFVVYHDQTASYGGDALANPVMAMLLFLGIGLGLWRWQRPVYALLQLWFWGALIGGGVLTLSPPTSNRLVMLTPVVALLSGLALAEILRLVMTATGEQHRQTGILVLVSIFALPIAFADVNFYFREYLPRYYFGGTHAYIATRLGYEIGAESYPPHLYFGGTPYMWSGFSTLGFLAPYTETTDLVDPLKSVDDVNHLVKPGEDMLFVFLPHRKDEVTVVQARFPSGVYQEVLFPADGSIAYVTYRVKPPQP